MRRCMLAILAFCFLVTTRLEAAIQLHGLFTDGMVLQQEMKVPIWGTASPGEKVTVKFQGQSPAATADAKGAWKVELESLKPGGPFELTVAGTDTVTLSDVLVGEVWICSGQSNMEWSTQQTYQAKEAIAKADYPMVRLLQVPKTPQKEPIADFVQKAKWLPCSPSTVASFSAVGYYFGRDLHQARKVPIGLIQSAWGGTPAERWTSAETFAKYPELKGLKGSDLYNGMIAPLVPFAFKGVIWYQGESNADKAWAYRTLFPAMIKNWREDWGGQDFPFLFVQLAPWDVPKTPTWAELREAQLYTAQTVKNAAQVVITDYGDRKDIHPPKKEPVGARLALAARALAYGEKITWSGPEYASKKLGDGKIALSFKYVDKGLMAADENGKLAADNRLEGFTIAGADDVFLPAEAKIEGQQVIVWNDKLTEPREVRFGWANYPVVNLFNAAGLPATPFRTDTLPALTAKAPKQR